MSAPDADGPACRTGKVFLGAAYIQKNIQYSKNIQKSTSNQKYQDSMKFRKKIPRSQGPA